LEERCQHGRGVPKGKPVLATHVAVKVQDGRPAPKRLVKEAVARTHAGREWVLSNVHTLRADGQQDTDLHPPPSSQDVP
jgi:hypothetical protein